MTFVSFSWRPLVWLFLLLLSPVCGFSQSALDSLLTLYREAPADTGHLKVIHALVNHYMYRSPTQAKAYASEGLHLAQQLEAPRGQSTFHYQLGVFYSGANQLDSADYQYDRALEFAMTTGDTHQQSRIYHGKAILAFDRGNLDEAEEMVQENIRLDQENGDSLGVALSWDFIGQIHRNKGHYQRALQYFLASLKGLEGLDEPIREADVLNHLAAVEYHLGHFAQGITYNQRAVEIYRAQEDLAYEAQALNDMGNCYKQLDSLTQALRCYTQSMEKAEQAGAASIAGTAQSNLGALLVRLGRQEEGLAHLRASLARFESLNYTRKVAVTQNMLAQVYNTLGRPAEALTLLQAAIDYADKADSKATLMTALKYRSESYRLQGNYRQALADHQAFKTVSDTLLNQEKIRRIEEMRVIHDTEQKESALALQQAEIAVLDAAVKRSKLRKALYGTGMVSFIALSGLLFFGFQQQLKRKRLEHPQQKALMQQEIDFKKKELMSQTLHLVHKNTFLEDLREQLESIRGTSGDVQGLLGRLKFEEMNDQDWEVFKSYFADVHNHFDQKLQEHASQISESEIRLAALLRMNLSTKEIAAILHVQPDSVLKSKYRLKKKLQLEKDTDLADFLKNL